MASISSQSLSLSPSVAVARVERAHIGFAGHVDQLRELALSDAPWKTLIALATDARTLAITGIEGNPC